MEDVNACGESPIALELPRHSRAEEPIGAVQARDPGHLRFQFVIDLVIHEQAVTIFVPVGHQILVVIEKRALKHLNIQTRIRRQIEIQSHGPVERVLRYDAIAVCGPQNGELATVRINRFSLQDHRAEILRQRTTRLIDAIMPGLVNDRSGRACSIAVEGRIDVHTTVQKPGNIPAALECRESQTVV